MKKISNLFFALFILFISCTNKKADLSSYYFNLNKTDSIIYEYYNDINDVSQYWMRISNCNNQSNNTCWIGFNNNLDKNMEFKETYDKNGVSINEYKFWIYEPEDVLEFDCNILEKYNYIWELNKNQEFSYKISINGPTPLHIKLIEQEFIRKFLGFENLKHNNKEVKCAVFEDINIIYEFYTDGSFSKNTFKGIKYYGKNIGLIKYYDITDNTEKDIFLLRKIHHIDDFSGLLRKRSENKIQNDI